MLTALAFLLFLGLIVFGPKKTMDMCMRLAGAMKQFEREIHLQPQTEITVPAPLYTAPTILNDGGGER
jgi:Sec-independent protein translocase protein TatA